MSLYKILLIGDAEVGKTNLMARIAGKPFKTAYKSTIGPDFESVYRDSKVLQIWDTPGKALYKPALFNVSRNSDALIYCVDLSNPLDPVKIKNELNATLEEIEPKPIVILVGTKKDLCTDPEAELNSLIQKLADLGLKFDYSQMTSAKDEENNGIEELITGVCANLKELENTTTFSGEKEQTSDYETEESLYQQAKKKLQKTLHDQASEAICAQIDEELAFLEACLHVPGLEAKAITRFNHNCHVILEGSHPLLINSILSFVAVTTITVLAGMLGFGIGVAAGLWTGPAAFLTGVLAAEAAALSVIAVAGTLGLGLGGAYSHYGLFNKHAPANEAVDEFVNDLQAPAI